MRNEQFWKEHIKVYNYIRDNCCSFRDIDLATGIKERFKIDIAPENIRYLRRKEGWKKRVSPAGESVEKFEKAVFITCLHIPFHDKELFALFLVFLKYFKPDILFILGDYLDWYQVSYFDKNPKRIGYLQDDIDTGERLLDMMLKLVDKIVFLDGNHEWRMVRYLRKNPELYGLKCLQISSLLGLSERKIKHHNYLSPPIKYHGLQIHHGSLVRKYSGWTAKGHYEKYGGCGIVGHCLSQDTKILTPFGWKKENEIESGDIVATMNLKTQAVEFQIVEQKFVYTHYKEAIHFKGHRYDSLVSPEHTIHYQTHYTGKWVKREAREFLTLNPKSGWRFPLAAKTRGRSDYPIDDNWIAFTGWAVSEGCFSVTGRIDISQREGINAEEIEEIAQRLGLDYRKETRRQAGQKYVFGDREVTAKYDLVRLFFRKTATRKIRKVITEKRLPLWCFLLSDRQAEILLNTLVKGDGTITGKTARVYYTSDETLANQIQGFLALHGKISTVSKDEREGHAVSYRVGWSNGWITRAEPVVSLEPYQGIMWCVTVPNGTLITQRNGKVMVLGNSHRGGNFLKRNTEGVFGWWEGFCMCQLKPEYLDFADWIQGWSIAYFYKKDLFHLEQVPVIKHKFLFQGKLFSAK